MFGIEVMTGAMFFALLNIATLLIGLYIVIKIAEVFYAKGISNVEFKDIRRYVIAAVVFVLVGLFLNTGAVRPKIAIDIPAENRQMIEHRMNDREIEIVTPPPRVENLDGFVPLKQD